MGARAARRFFACSCFFPYPALAIGGSNGLQLSQALALAGVPFFFVRVPGRPFRALLLILTPIYLSALVNSMLDSTPSNGFLPKESVALTLAMLVLWPADWVMQRDLFREVLVAACAAIFVHALIGLYQVRSFAHDEFPLLFLYRNPSFKSMEEWSRVYAVYIKRPCGLFPEPSAMAASLGAWLVLLSGLLADPQRAAARAFGWRRGTGPRPRGRCRLLARRPVSFRLDVRDHGVGPRPLRREDPELVPLLWIRERS